jgi:hypothetical protein
VRSHAFEAVIPGRTLGLLGRAARAGEGRLRVTTRSGRKVLGAVRPPFRADLIAEAFVLRSRAVLEHDPQKWKPVFRKDHAQTMR